MNTREVIEAQREAYLAGALRRTELHWVPTDWVLKQEAERRYPFPTVTRPRILAIGRIVYRVVDGVMQSRHTNDIRWYDTEMAGEDFVRLAWLFDNPTETVEVE